MSDWDWSKMKPLGPWRLWTFTEYVYDGPRIVGRIPRKHWGRSYELLPGGRDSLGSSCLRSND